MSLTPQLQALARSLMGVLRLIDATIAPAEPTFYRVFCRIVVAHVMLRLARLRPPPPRRPTAQTHTAPETETDPADTPARPPAEGRDVPEFQQDLARLHAHIERALNRTEPLPPTPRAAPPKKHPYRYRARRGFLDQTPGWIEAVGEIDATEARAALDALLHETSDWTALCARCPAIVRALQDVCHMLGVRVPPWVRAPVRPRKKRPSIKAESDRIAAAIRSPWATPEGPGVPPFSQRGISGLLPGDGPPCLESA